MRSPESRILQWSFLGRVPYAEADKLQRSLRESLRAGKDRDVLLLLEHPHVFTVGRSASRRDILADDEWLTSLGVEVIDSDRGGKVTYHGPGQLVGYPILDLDPDRRDLRRYVRDLQQVLLLVLQDLGIEAEARTKIEEIGIWVDDQKIASIGVHVSRWITTHGFALNLSTDLSFFSGIVPCGLQGVKMTSLESVTGRRMELEEISPMVAERFAQVFCRRSVQLDSETIRESWSIDS